MIKVIKYASDGTFPDSRRKGNFLVGESTVAYGPTSSTGFYNGITPPEGGYTLYLAKETQGPSIFSFDTGTELLDFCNNSLGSDQSTVFGVIDWINDQSNYFVDPNYFEFTAKTDNSGVSTSTQFKLPLVSNGTINFLVDWGDNSTNTITSFNQAETTHTYSSAGTYTIKIAGNLKGWQFNGGGDRLKFLEVKKWGCLNLSVGAAFTSCSNMTCTAVDSPRITSTSFVSMFSGCNAFNGNIGNWDVTTVTNMDNMFFNSLTFNNGGSPSINNWDVSNVTSMSQGFRNAQLFNQPIGGWNVGKVTTMWTMMQQTYSFDQELSSWNTGSVTSMHGLFAASKFNKNISNWNTSKVTSVSYMFSKEWYQQYTNPVGDWDISSLTSAGVFMNTGSFGTSNYDDLLIKWSAKPKKNNVSLFVTAKYSSAAASARSTLVNTFGWTITDQGEL